MKTWSGTNVWYLLVLIALAIIFIFAGVKYLGHGEINNTQSVTAPDSKTPDKKPEENSSNTLDLPLDQQFAAKGAEAMSKGDYATAIDYFSKAIAENPSNTGYYSLKAQAEVLAGKTDEAKSTLEAGIKVDPTNELLNSKLDVLNKDYFQSPSFDATRE